MTKVLIIEDEPLVARLYEKALTRDNFDVDIAKDGEEGLSKAKASIPDVILCDIMLPKLSGIEVLEKLKNDVTTGKICVIILSNLSGMNDVELSKEKGANAYIVKKDIKPSELGDEINKVLGKRVENAD